MSYIGTTKIGGMYLGSVEIAKAYLGTDLVFQKGGGPTPPVHELVFYDRLVFDGTAYIDTDIVLPANCSIKVSLGNETSKVAQRVFQASDGSGSISLVYTSNTTATYRYFGAYYDSASSLLSNSRRLGWSNATYGWFMTPSRCGYSNGTAWTYTKGNAHPNTALRLGYNIAGTGQAYTGVMRNFLIYGSDASGATSYAALDNYTPVYTLRPCTYDGEPGMWNVEQSKFYGNTAGAGQLSVENI